MLQTPLDTNRSVCETDRTGQPVAGRSRLQNPHDYDIVRVYAAEYRAS